jgi:hypothetical protein
MAKWVALTARKLKPGSYDDWRQAWEAGAEPPSGATAYICRSVKDPDEIVAFGIVEASKEEVEARRGQESDDSERQAAMAPHVESVGTDGFYEVIEEVTF